jgi:hypothetical protein
MLHELGDEYENPRSLMHRASPSQKKEMRRILLSSKTDLKDLEKILGKYNSLKTDNPRAIDKIRFDSGQQAEMKAKISGHTDRINLFLTHLNAGALGRIESNTEAHTKAFEEIKAKLDSIHEDIRTGKMDSTILTNMEDWGQLEKELVDDNITEVDVELNREHISKWLQKLRDKNAVDIDRAAEPVSPLDNPTQPVVSVSAAEGLGISSSAAGGSVREESSHRRGSPGKKRLNQVVRAGILGTVTHALGASALKHHIDRDRHRSRYQATVKSDEKDSVEGAEPDKRPLGFQKTTAMPTASQHIARDDEDVSGEGSDRGINITSDELGERRGKEKPRSTITSPNTVVDISKDKLEPSDEHQFSSDTVNSSVASTSKGGSVDDLSLKASKAREHLDLHQAGPRRRRLSDSDLSDIPLPDDLRAHRGSPPPSSLPRQGSRRQSSYSPRRDYSASGHHVPNLDPFGRTTRHDQNSRLRNTHSYLSDRLLLHSLRHRSPSPDFPYLSDSSEWEICGRSSLLQRRENITDAGATEITPIFL